MFEKERLTEDESQRLGELSRVAKGDIITMTRLAGSGHPGGSISSLDAYLVLFSYAKLNDAPRDRIVVSHGHTSPGVYASLARLGYLPVDEVVAFFRKAGSPFEGHVVKGIPFIDWSTGNLGQGLSAGCGFALGVEAPQRGLPCVRAHGGRGAAEGADFGGETVCKEIRPFQYHRALSIITVFR